MQLRSQSSQRKKRRATLTGWPKSTFLRSALQATTTAEPLGRAPWPRGSTLFCARRRQSGAELQRQSFQDGPPPNASAEFGCLRQRSENSWSLRAEEKRLAGNQTEPNLFQA